MVPAGKPASSSLVQPRELQSSLFARQASPQISHRVTRATSAAVIWPRKIARGKFQGLIQTNTPRPCREAIRVWPSKPFLVRNPVGYLFICSNDRSRRLHVLHQHYRELSYPLLDDKIATSSARLSSIRLAQLIKSRFSFNWSCVPPIANAASAPVIAAETWSRLAKATWPTWMPTIIRCRHLLNVAPDQPWSLLSARDSPLITGPAVHWLFKKPFTCSSNWCASLSISMFNTVRVLALRGIPLEAEES